MLRIIVPIILYFLFFCSGYFYGQYDSYIDVQKIHSVYSAQLHYWKGRALYPNNWDHYDM